MAQHLRRLVDMDAAWKDRTPAPGTFAEVFRRHGESSDALAALDTWLSLQGDGVSAGRRLVNSLRWVGLVTTLLGIVLGAGFMQVLIAYDGTLQVNVLWIIALTLVQTLLCLVALIMMLRRSSRLAGLSDVVGHWPRWMLGVLHPLLSAPFQEPSFWQALHKPWLLREAQRMGFWFALSAFVVLCVHVVVEDLAFGWATTLALTPEFLHGVTQFLAMPWQWQQTAVPSLELVQQSQFFRLQGGAATHNPQLLAQWWPFLAWLWLVYALLPRTLLWLLAEWRWRAVVGQALVQHPRYAETLQGFRFDHEVAARQSAEILAALLADVLSHRETRTVLGLDKVQLQQASQQLTIQWKTHISGAERAAWHQVAALYLQHQAERQDEPEWPEADSLFAVDEWERWGLDRKKLALLAGLGGAGTGAAIDVATGGLSMGAISAVMGVAAAAGVYLSPTVAEQVADAGQIRVGPARHRNFPWVMVGRSVQAWQVLVSRLPGSRRAAQDFPDWRKVVSGKQERELKRLFSALRESGREQEEQRAVEAQLAGLLADILVRLLEVSVRPGR